LPPYERDLWFRDDQLSGFGLKITKRGHQSFVLDYRLHGKTGRLTYPGAGGVDEARAWAHQMRAQIIAKSLSENIRRDYKVFGA